MATFPESGDALDVLEHEDQVLKQLLERLRGDEDDRLTHGVAGKLLIKHLAVREAAKEILADSLAANDVGAEHVERLQAGTMARREMIAHLDEMARGLRPIDLNQGQDFDGAVESLREVLNPELCTELEEVVPALREELSSEQRQKILPRARWVARHAPTHPNPHAKHGYEHFGPLVRLHAWYDRMREYPTGNKWAREKLPELTEHR